MWLNQQFPVDLVTFTEEIRNEKVKYRSSLRLVNRQWLKLIHLNKHKFWYSSKDNFFTLWIFDTLHVQKLLRVLFVSIKLYVLFSPLFYHF